jgi:hypothetical protein
MTATTTHQKMDALNAAGYGLAHGIWYLHGLPVGNTDEAHEHLEATRAKVTLRVPLEPLWGFGGFVAGVVALAGAAVWAYAKWGGRG